MSKPMVKFALEIADKVLIILFSIEVVLKILAYGIQRYFTKGWCCIEFIVVIVI